MRIRLRFGFLLRPAMLACSLVGTLACAQNPPAAPASPAPVYKLVRLLIADTEAKAIALRAAPEAGAVVVQDVPVLAPKEFTAVIQRYIGQPITTELVNKVAGDIQAYVRRQDRIVVDTLIPTQDISTGELRMAVIIGNQNPPTASASPAPVYKLVRLLIADTEAKAIALQAAPEAGAVVVQDVPVLAPKGFTAVIQRYIGQPLTTELVNRVAGDIQAYVRRQDRLVVDTLIPTQDISTGELRMVVIIGKYKQLQFKGNRWFSRELLEARLGVKPGDEVRLSTLEEAINWTNANPFRRVQVLVNNLPAEPGQADLIVNVQERLPVRFAAAYDNTGNEVIGINHYTASLQFGNLWGLDHQGSYQFTTTDQTHVYQAHSADYRVPLPWRHYLQFTGAYSEVHPTFGGSQNNDFSLTGESLLANVRYIAPVEHGAYSMEFSAGVDFKETNNNLEYTGYGTVRATKNDIFQLNLASTIVHRDSRGAWVFGANLSLSPGNLNSRNSDDAFGIARPRGDSLEDYRIIGYTYTVDSSGNVVMTPSYQGIGQSRYAVGTLVVQRMTNLPAGYQLVFRGQLQKASANLLSTEQLSIGGQGTVRGYDERIVSGDEGLVLNQELQGPVWNSVLRSRGRNFGTMQSRLVAFWDYGKVWEKHTVSRGLDPLMSAGLGLRCSVGNNFNLIADYGWQLWKTTPPQPDRGRISIKATLAY